MQRVLGLTTALLFAACGGHDAATDPCVMRVDVIAPEPMRVNGSRTVEVDIIERSGNCRTADKEIEWATSNRTVLEITASSQTSATVVGHRVSSATISAWLVATPAIRDSVTIAVAPLVDN